MQHFYELEIILKQRANVWKHRFSDHKSSVSHQYTEGWSPALNCRGWDAGRAASDRQASAQYIQEEIRSVSALPQVGKKQIRLALLSTRETPFISMVLKASGSFKKTSSN